MLGTNGAVIAMSSSASVALGTDFGENVMGTSLTRTFTITNAWDQELTFGAVAIGGAHGDFFTVTAQPSSPLSAGQTSSFDVRFEPPTVGSFSAEVFITNNVPDESPYRFMLAGTGRAPPYATVTSATYSSSSTFTVPARVYSLTVEARGGGGGGGSGEYWASGGGGGGGAYARVLLEVEPEEQYTVTVGEGGAGGPAAGGDPENGSAGAAGGDSWFGTTATVLAKGGSGAGGAHGGDGGTEGDSVGEVRFSGGQGGDGALKSESVAYAGGGGGGSSAGMADAGADGASLSGAAGGGGGVAPEGGGDGGGGGGSGLAGNAGQVPGGGGGGSGNDVMAGLAGGAGANGRVVVSYVILPDIMVLGTNLQEVASGSSPEPGTGTDFGAVGAGFNRTHTFTITNLWTNALTIDPVSIGGDHGGEFTVTAQPTTPLAAGGASTFDIRFAPGTDEPRHGVVYITNNVPGRSPYTFSLAGNDVAVVWSGGGGNANWDTLANWTGGALPGADERAEFYSGIGSGTNINLNGNRSVAGLRFNDQADTALRLYNSTLTLGAAGITVAAGAAGAHVIASSVALGADQEWAIHSAAPLRVQGVISGAHGLTKTGGGTLTLTANNTFSGTARVSGGVLDALATEGLRYAESIRVENGATLLSTNEYVSGFFQGAAANREAVLTGAGSTLENRYPFFVVGDTGSGNRLTVTNGAQLITQNTDVGVASGSTGNVITVAGTSSRWDVNGYLCVGDNGPFNEVTIGSGAVVQNGIGYVGWSATANGNRVRVDGPGAVWTNSGVLYLGSSGRANELLVTGGGSVHSVTGYIGFLTGATGNVATISGAGSLWNNSSDLYLGYSGGVSRLEISDGGRVGNAQGILGFSTGAADNRATVSGAGAVWANESYVLVGSFSTGNRLEVLDGGRVESTLGVLGLQAVATGNTGLVSGAGSVWSNSGSLYAGYVGRDNTMLVENGGQLESAGGVINFFGTSSGNRVMVDGAGSLWQNSGTLFVGYSGSVSRLSISNGAQVVNTSGYVGYWPPSSGNVAMVSGSGSVWSNTTQLVVGDEGHGNLLRVTDSGRVSAGAMIIGQYAASSNNQVTVDGGVLHVSGSLDIRRGTNLLSGGGEMDLGGLTLNNGTGRFLFHGGLLTTRSALVENGHPFTVGDGVSSSRYLLEDGEHTFTDGLLVNTSAAALVNGELSSASADVTVFSGGLLGGTGTVSRVVTLRDGASIRPGAGDNEAGTLSVAGLTFLDGARFVLSCDTSATGRVDVTGTVTFDSSPSITVRLEELAGAAFGVTNVMLTYGALSGTPSWIIDYGTTGRSDVEVIHDTDGKRFLVIIPPSYPGNPWQWSGAGSDDNWSTGANWTNGVAPPSHELADLLFTGSTRLVNVNDAGAARLLRHLTFSAAAGAFELRGGPLTLHGRIRNLSASGQTVTNAITLGAHSAWAASAGNLHHAGALDNAGFELTIDGEHTTTLSGGLAGGGALVKTNSGLLRLAADNTFSGAIRIGGGAVEASATGALQYATNLALAGAANLLTAGDYAAGFFMEGGARRDALISGGSWSNTGHLRMAGDPGTRLSVQGGRLAIPGTFDLVSGTNLLAGGELEADHLTLTNSAGRLVFSGGELLTRGATVHNGAVFTVGDGSGAATYRIESGTHSFAGGLTAANASTVIVNGVIGGSAGEITVGGGAALLGTGQVERTVTLQSGARLSPGLSDQHAGTLTAANLSLEDGAVYRYQRGDGVNDLVTVTDTLAFISSPTITVRLETLAGGAFAETNVLMAYASHAGAANWQIDYGTTGLLGCRITNNTAEGRIELILPQVVEGNPWQWNGGGANANWNTAANWTNNSVPPDSNDTRLLFSGATRPVNTNNAANPMQVFELTFAVGAGAFTLRGSPLSIQAQVANLSGNGQTIANNITLTDGNAWRATDGNLTFGGTVNNAGHFLRIEGDQATTLGGILSGNGPLIKQDGGLLRLTANNTYSGATRVSGGTLEAAALNALLNTTNILVETGARLLTTNEYGAGFYEGTAANREALVTGTGSAWTNRNDFRIGDSGGNNALTVSGGGRMAVLGEGALGYWPASTRNTVTISGTGSVWNCSSFLTVGDEGSENELWVEEGGLLENTTGFVGYFAVASGNVVRVTGPGATWRNSGGMYLGVFGRDNRVHIQNAAQLESTLGLLGYGPASSNNTLEISGANTRWINTGAVYLGYSGSVNRVTLSGGARKNATTTYVGYYPSASANEAALGGAGTIWSNSANFIVGDEGSFNKLAVSNGATLISVAGILGLYPPARSNQVLVSGMDALWQNSQGLYVGRTGSWNRLAVEAGGRVNSASGYVGFAAASTGNVVEVSGSGSRWVIGGPLSVGESGSHNSLLIENGGRVNNTLGYVGYAASSASNSVLVTGAGSTWSNSGYLSVGETGAYNTVTISNGARVVNGAGYVGWGTSSRGNTVAVYGEGSVWSNRQLLYLGAYGPANRLIVNDGGLVFATNIAVGATTSSTNNAVEVRGGTLQTPGEYSLLRGTNLLANGGTIDVHNLQIPIAAGRFNFDGGTLITRTAYVGNGHAFLIGDGQSEAAYRVEQGGHNFADGLTVNTNASLLVSGTILSGASGIAIRQGGTLGGTGRINRLATLQSGATIHPGPDGLSGGTLTVSNLTFQDSTIYIMTISPDSTGRVDVAGTLTFVSDPVITIHLERLDSAPIARTNILFNYGQCSGEAIWQIAYSGIDSACAYVVDDTEAGQILLITEVGTPGGDCWQWSGNGTDNNWSMHCNWTNIYVPASAPTNDLVFSGTGRLVNTNNVASSFEIRNLIFSADAGAFELRGMPLLIHGGVTNYSPSLQTIATPLTLGGNTVWESFTGQVRFTGAIDNNGYSLEIGSASDTSLDNALSGSGALVKSGAGTLSLTAPNAHTGGTYIHAGTLRIAADEQLGSGTLVLDGGALDVTNSATLSAARTIQIGTSGGTIRVAEDQTVAYAGVIGGDGLLEKTGPGTLELTGQNTFTGGIVIHDGILKGTTESLRGPIGNNAILLIEQDASGTNGAAISGTGSLRKSGTGHVVLTNTLTHSGGVQVEAGSLTLRAISNSGPVVVFSGAKLTATGHVGALSVTGTLDTVTGAAPGTLHCSTLSLANGATLGIALNATTNSMVQSAGNAALAGTITLDITKQNPVNIFNDRPFIYHAGDNNESGLAWLLNVDALPALSNVWQVSHRTTGSGEYYIQGASPTVSIESAAPETNLWATLRVETINGYWYDLIGLDAARYQDEFSSASRWTLLDRLTATNTTAIFSNDLATLAYSNMRFFRVSPLGAWSNQAYTSYATEEVYVGKRIPLMPGRNWLALPCIPSDSSLDNVLGTGGNLPPNTSVFTYTNAPDGRLHVDRTYYTPAGSGGVWQWDKPGGETDPDAGTNHLTIAAGFLLSNPADQTIPLGVIGRMRIQTNVLTVPGPHVMTFISPLLPSAMHPAELNFLESGFHSHTHQLFSDQIFLWDPVNQRRKGDIIWYHTGTGWTIGPQTPLNPNNKIIGPTDAFIIRTGPMTTTWTWTNLFYYTPPAQEMNP